MANSGRKMTHKLMIWSKQMYVRSLLSATLIAGTLLSVHLVAQQANKGAGNADLQVKDAGGQPNNSRPADQATDGRVNVTVAPQKEEKEDSGSSTPKSWGWIPWFFSVLISWPCLAALLTIYVLRNPERIQNILLHVRSFKLFGAEFVMDREGRSKAEAAIQVYRDAVKERFDAISASENIADKHKQIVDKLLDGAGGLLKGANIRSTIYVPDILFDETLYQLLDYYPPTQDSGKRGRIFSARYGMIGRSWRLEQSDVNGTVSTNPEDLVRSWAMTRKEAKEAALERKSFACILLKNASDECLGVFYMDSLPERVFDATWVQVEEFVRTQARSNELIKSLQKISTDLIASSARVRIYKR
jgi:hypothetical protein